MYIHIPDGGRDHDGFVFQLLVRLEKLLYIYIYIYIPFHIYDYKRAYIDIGIYI